VAWYATSNIDYTYSNISKKALPFTPVLLSLKQIVEQKTGETYNACLLNLYQNGSEGMGWHSDDEKELEPMASIASLSLGAERKFSLKHKQNKQTVSVILENGSLLEMKNETQLFWKHALPKTTKVLGPRINLTFRKMVI
jgi:alkylated DNA repair dioxygenase AlkB